MKYAKRKLKVSFFLLCWLILSHIMCFSQEISEILQKADMYFAAQNYNKAIKYYLKAYNINNYSKETNLKCARCYIKLEMFADADRFYSNVLKQSDSINPSIFLEYGELQLKLGHPELARSYLVSYNNLIEKNDIRALRYIKSIEDIDKYYLDSSYITVERLAINSPYNDYNPIEFKGKLYLESNRETGENLPIMKEIYVSAPNQEKSFEPASVYKLGLNSIPRAGFTIDRCSGSIVQSIKNIDSAKSNYILVSCPIESDGQQVAGLKQIVVDSFNFDILNPTLSKSCKKLIFSSETPAGIGGLDLYISFQNNGKYCRPKPLNNLINTLGDESYPFLENDSILFFASTGQGGLGGFDIYYVNLNDQGSIPTNLGYPINSRFDDYGLSLSESGHNGYFVSNRSSDNTFSEIFSFKIVKLHALGLASDERTGENLKNIEIDIIKPDKPSTQIVLADNGYFSLDALPNEEFDLIFKKLNYKQKGFHISTYNIGISGLLNENIGNFKIMNLTDTEKLNITVKEPIAENAKNNIDTVDQKKNIKQIQKYLQGIIKFRVQIAASRKPLNDQMLALRYTGNKSIFMYQEEGWYKYAIGEFDTYFDAKKLLKQCGVNDAFIASYMGNKKLILMSAIHQVSSEYIAESQVNNMVEKEEVLKTMEFLYPTDIFEIDQKEIYRLDSLVELLNTNENLFVEINGYTDNQGSYDYNFGLGAVRAEFIREYLMKKGINHTRIMVRSFGKTNPKMPCPEKCDDTIQSENRRVTISIYKKMTAG